MEPPVLLQTPVTVWGKPLVLSRWEGVQASPDAL